MFDFSAFLTNSHTLAAAVTLVVTMAILCLYYGLFHFRVGRWKLKEKPGETPQSLGGTPPVSVVLTACNDANWLRENLVYLLEQDYPDFEVVVVDYLSKDDTPSVLKLLKDYYPHLKAVPFVGNISVREGVALHEDVNLFQGKKYPLSIGIKSAKNDIVLLADPDCMPKNMQWLRGMVKGYMTRETQIVLGYCGLKRTKTLLGAMQQYDNLAYSCHYLGSALLGHPYTGSGRNLSYRRQFFFKRGAFISHYDIATGSDDLFVYHNADRKTTAVCIGEDALLTTEPKGSFAQWHQLRLDRVATRNRHSVGSRLAEHLLPVGNLLFYAAAAYLMLRGPWGLVLLLVLLKWAWQIVALWQPSRRFDAGLVYLAAPLLEIYFIVANTILILTPLHSNRKFKK